MYYLIHRNYYLQERVKQTMYMYYRILKYENIKLLVQMLLPEIEVLTTKVILLTTCFVVESYTITW